MSNIFFISDLHFSHDSLIGFRNEVHGLNFQNTTDMNLHIMEKWNSRVRPQDLVWVLGDVSWSKEGLEYLNLLDGHKRLILGNHDTERLNVRDFLPYFEEIHGVIKKYGFVMSHVPINPAQLEFNWKYNLHGHIHHRERDLTDIRYLNVNTDVRDFLPMSLQEVRDAFKKPSNSIQK